MTEKSQEAIEHNLYKTGDMDAPDVIKDHNGDVVLSQCRRCGRGEIELREPCDAVASKPGEWLRTGRLVYSLEEYHNYLGRLELRNRWDAEVQAATGTPEAELESVATLMQAAPDLLAAVKDQAAWIERLLQTLEHRTAYDHWGNPVNGFAFSPVPEWEMRQKLDSLREDIARVEGATLPKA